MPNVRLSSLHGAAVGVVIGTFLPAMLGSSSLSETASASLTGQIACCAPFTIVLGASTGAMLATAAGWIRRAASFRVQSNRKEPLSMEAIGGVLSAFGLAASAGLNAYVPLLLVVGRFTDGITLGPTWDPLTSWRVICALVVLGTMEFFADKIPAVHHANDLVQTFVRPAVSVTTGGAANVPASISEDILATTQSILAIVVPVAVAALIILRTAFLIWQLWRRARHEAFS